MRGSAAGLTCKSYSCLLGSVLRSVTRTVPSVDLTVVKESRNWLTFTPSVPSIPGARLTMRLPVMLRLPP